MKNLWKIHVPSEEKERIAVTYGDPAEALIATKEYALHPLPKAITNWHAVVPLIKTDHWYDITAFYSKRKAELHQEAAQLLFDYNQKAFYAAKKTGTLVLYYQGVLLSNENHKTKPDLNLSFVPNCLSFCIWNTLADAKSGSQTADHKKATQMTSMWFDGFAIEKYELMIQKTNQGKIITIRRVEKKRSSH